MLNNLDNELIRTIFVRLNTVLTVLEGSVACSIARFRGRDRESCFDCIVMTGP